MASLFIKNDKAVERVAILAERLGTTKVDVVLQGLDALEQKLAADSSAKTRNWLEWIKDYRARNPLPPPTGLKADKAFFDEMWGEDPD